MELSFHLLDIFSKLFQSVKWGTFCSVLFYLLFFVFLFVCLFFVVCFCNIGPGNTFLVPLPHAGKQSKKSFPSLLSISAQICNTTLHLSLRFSIPFPLNSIFVNYGLIT